jgi:hypothetical protein
MFLGLSLYVFGLLHLGVRETRAPTIRQYSKKWPVRMGWFVAYFQGSDLPELDRTGILSVLASMNPV